MSTKLCPICKRSFETNHGRQVYCHTCLAFPETGKAVVYALCQLGKSDVRYIGSTTNPVKRFMDHRQNAHGPEIKQWVKSIKGNIDMTILKIVPKSKARKSEEVQIQYYERLGHKLLNKRAAGKMFTSQEANDYIARWFKNSK
jgi:predicted GIY-YIG superfamily endonuclease